MTFDEILTQVLDLLQRERRLSYRALKVRFALDDDSRSMKAVESWCGLALPPRPHRWPPRQR